MDGELPFIYKPLEPYKKQTVIFSGLHSRSAEPPPGATGADHWVAAAFLCANKPKKTAGADVSVFGPTIDQMIAQKIGQDNLLPSMQLNVEDPGPTSSNCGEGYSCTYTNSISWVSANQPLPMELNPQVVFERMFGDGSTVEQRASRRARDRSILDSLGDSLSRLRVKLSAVGQASHRRIRGRHPRNRAAAADCDEGVDRGAGRDGGARRRAADLRRAHQAAVRPAGAGVPRRHDPRRHDDLRARPHRPHLSRERGADRRASTARRTTAKTRRRILDHARINQYHVKMLAYFVDKLAKAEDGDGTLLDHSLVLYGTNMGNSNQHLHHDVPARAGWRLERQAQGRTPSGVSEQDGADRQSAAERPRFVRHPSGQLRATARDGWRICKS